MVTTEHTENTDMEHGTMADERGMLRRTVWYDNAGRRHESLSVPWRRRARHDFLDALAFMALSVVVAGVYVLVLVELARSL